ncbi:hypothetical protein B0I37DRAFT_155673 [Chaetomium sp. MPI-CAGE-AT-0009]|nr:hypothetical protein B0I37DRAFT_155673 [Chaetomium sp. MPI-CAGE-AT-0009]
MALARCFAFSLKSRHAARKEHNHQAFAGLYVCTYITLARNKGAPKTRRRRMLTNCETDNESTCRKWQPHRREEKFSPYHVAANNNKRKMVRRKILPWLHEKCHPSRRCGWEGARTGNVSFLVLHRSELMQDIAAVHAKNGSTSPSRPGKGDARRYSGRAHRPFVRFRWAFGRRRCSRQGLESRRTESVSTPVPGYSSFV